MNHILRTSYASLFTSLVAICSVSIGSVATAVGATGAAVANCESLFAAPQEKTASIEDRVLNALKINAQSLELNEGNWLFGLPTRRKGDLREGFAALFFSRQSKMNYNQAASDYWPGVTLSLSYAHDARPTRFDSWTYGRYVKDAKPWTREEEMEYRKWQHAKRELRSFNFDPAEPEKQIATGNVTVVTYKERHTGMTLPRRLELTITHEGKLQSVLVTGPLTKLYIRMTEERPVMYFDLPASEQR